MSGFIDKRAPGASEPSGLSERVLTWHACRAMLPLVGRIAQDVVRYHERLAAMRPELDQLEKNRRALNWPQRRRRYQLEDEIAAAETELRSAVAELEVVGVALLDPATGLVGFPTLVNERKAYFTWRPGEGGPDYWNYAGDATRRPVPAEWTEEPKARAPRRAQPRKK
jgi:hypothetical protein